jgi:hypothetical protein
MYDKHYYYKMLRLGYLRKELRDRKERLAAPLSLRGGNSSACFGNRIIGLNPKSAVLRYLGLELPNSFDTQLLFAGGFGNETHHSELLNEAGVDFKEEEQVPINWSVTVLNDDEEPITFPISGRPDHCLMKDDKVVFVLEQKQIASSWKSFTLANFGEAQPKPENICQAAHYSYMHGKVPSALVYTSRTWNAAKKPTSKFINPEHRAVMKGGEDFVIGIKPHMALYDLEWRDDDYLYMDARKTVITFARIQQYYELIAHSIVTKTIPDFHYSDQWGKPMTKSKVEKYWNFKDCPETDWDTWISAVTAKCDAAWKELEDELKEMEGESTID